MTGVQTCALPISFLAPPGPRPGLAAAHRPPRIALFLLRWEWFRIYFCSGLVKLLSGDPQWHSLTALEHYYENGPLPTWLGWYAQELPPAWFHHACAAAVLVIELAMPWVIFLSARLRRLAFYLLTPFQLAIILTANYAFLNYLVLALGVWLLDDPWLQTIGLPAPPPLPLNRTKRKFLFFERASDWAARGVLGWILYSTIVLAPGLSHRLSRAQLLPAELLRPFRIANRYGLFAVMTEDRFEIEFQGSRDGQIWTPYSFRYKPQDPQRAPGIYAPYQPRFEWNLWFASLGDFRKYPFTVRTELRLLEGSPEVLKLFATDPFNGVPPEYIRAVKSQYWFTTPKERQRSGAWWLRQDLGLYAPELRRAGGEIHPVRMP